MQEGAASAASEVTEAKEPPSAAWPRWIVVDCGVQPLSPLHSWRTPLEAEGSVPLSLNKPLCVPRRAFC